MSARGGLIVLLSDGSENASPLVSEVLASVRSAAVSVDTIAMGPRADKQLESLSWEGGGTAHFVEDSEVTVTNSLDFAFFEATTAHLYRDNRPVVVRHVLNLLLFLEMEHQKLATACDIGCPITQPVRTLHFLEILRHLSKKGVEFVQERLFFF